MYNEIIARRQREFDSVVKIAIRVQLIVDCTGLLLVLMKVLTWKLFWIFVASSALTLIILVLLYSMKEVYG